MEHLCRELYSYSINCQLKQVTSNPSLPSNSHTRMHTHTHIHTRMHTHIHTRMHTHTHTHTHTHIPHTHAQILHGFKNEVGDQNWRVFADQFPPALREKLATLYQVWNTSLVRFPLPHLLTTEVETATKKWGGAHVKLWGCGPKLRIIRPHESKLYA